MSCLLKLMIDRYADWMAQGNVDINIFRLYGKFQKREKFLSWS